MRETFSGRPLIQSPPPSAQFDKPGLSGRGLTYNYMKIIKSICVFCGSSELVDESYKEVAEKNKELKIFLHKNMYSHRKVLRMEFKAALTLDGIFAAYKKMPGLLPEAVLKNELHGTLERRICDYVSGMTDRYALNEHKNLYTSDEEG